VALGRLPTVVEIIGTIVFIFLSVLCGHDDFVVASAINNVDCHAAQPNVTSCHDNTKVFDQRICCNGSCRETSFIAGTMALHCDGVAIGAIDFIVSTLAPSQLLKVVAQSPIVARGLLLPCMAYAALRPFVVRGSSLSCMTYTANWPCGEGLVVAPSPVTILGRGFVVAFFGERLLVALIGGCILLGNLAVLALGAVHAVFGILAVLTLGNVHAFSKVLAKPNLCIFLLLVVAWSNMAIVASCK
jgi:hypothetical protein